MEFYLACQGILASYILTIVLARSQLFHPIRELAKLVTPKPASFLGSFIWEVYEYPHKEGRDRRKALHIHPIECRLCAGGWISLGIAFVMVWAGITGVTPHPYHIFEHWFTVWGGSYFLSTQERDGLQCG